MNSVTLIGRLVRDPDIRQAGETKVARYTLAVDRFSKNEEQKADFISCVAFGRYADFAELYLHQGMKIAVAGRIQTGSYTKNDGTKVYTTDVVVNAHEFCEKRGEEAPAPAPAPAPEEPKDDWMDIPDGLEQEQLPFH